MEITEIKRAVFSCPFIPAEWIAAHGFKPSRIVPGTREPLSIHSEGLCPYVKAFLGAAFRSSADAILFTSTCDQMRRAPELLDRSHFLMHIPTTWESTNAWKLYQSELERLGRYLVSEGGEALAQGKLARIMADYDDQRKKLRAARGRLSARSFSEAIMAFHRDGTLPDLEGPEPARNGIPLALVGAPLLKEQFELFDTIEALGGRIVLDATTTGERSLPKPFDRQNLIKDPLSCLVEAYFGTIPDAFRRPNRLLYEWMEARIKERKIKGILFKRYTWCDTWHAEEQRMKEQMGLPFLSMDMGDDARLNKGAFNRMQSFLEILN